MDDKERARLNTELVKLADIIETCEHGDPDWNYYQGEYRKIAKILYPEMYPKQLRKPSQALIRTLTPCTCGEKTFRYKSNDKGRQFLCKKCERASEVCKTNALARDSWNNTFNGKLNF